MDFNEQGYGQGTDDVTDISAYNYLHLDYYTGYATQMRIILIENDGGNVTEYFYELPTNEAFIYDSWTSVDIDLSFFESQGFSKENFFQYKIGTESNLNPGIVFYDNLYFYQNVLDVVGFTSVGALVAPNPTNTVWQVQTSGQDILTIHVYDVMGKVVKTLNPHAAEVIIDSADLTSGLYFAHIKTGRGIQTHKLLKK